MIKNILNENEKITPNSKELGVSRTTVYKYIKEC